MRRLPDGLCSEHLLSDQQLAEVWCLLQSMQWPHERLPLPPCTDSVGPLVDHVQRAFVHGALAVLRATGHDVAGLVLWAKRHRLGLNPITGEKDAEPVGSEGGGPQEPGEPGART